MPNTNAANLLTKEEKDLLTNTKKPKTLLVKDTYIRISTDFYYTYPVYTYNPKRKNPFLKKVRTLHDSNLLSVYDCVIFVNCTIYIKSDTRAEFYNCVFINCSLDGDWSRVSIDGNATISNCKILSSPDGYFECRKYKTFYVKNPNTDLKDIEYFTEMYNLYTYSANNLLENVKGLKEHISLVPTTGAFKAYKGACYLPAATKDDPYVDFIPVVIELEIPEDAERVNSLSYKCRANKAKVLRIYDLHGQEYQTATSIRDKRGYYYGEPFTYTVGEIVYPDDWNNNPAYECTNGIHFFLEKPMAIYWLSLNFY